ncbi:MAG: hypothetical protein QM784_14150 [Polyangiaceae bacterium]
MPSRSDNLERGSTLETRAPAEHRAMLGWMAPRGIFFPFFLGARGESSPIGLARLVARSPKRSAPSDGPTGHDGPQSRRDAHSHHSRDITASAFANHLDNHFDKRFDVSARVARPRVKAPWGEDRVLPTAHLANTPQPGTRKSMMGNGLAGTNSRARLWHDPGVRRGYDRFADASLPVPSTGFEVRVAEVLRVECTGTKTGLGRFSVLECAERIALRPIRASIEPKVRRRENDRNMASHGCSPRGHGSASALKYLVDHEIVATRHVSTGYGCEGLPRTKRNGCAIALDIDADNSYVPRAKMTVVLSSNTKNGLWLVGFR